MFKKALAFMAVIGFAVTANVQSAAAHGYGGYHTHYPVAWAGLPIPKIRKTLRHRGYYRIRFTDRHLPVYKAKACKNGKRFKLRLNRWGAIRNRVRIGWCHHYPYY